MDYFIGICIGIVVINVVYLNIVIWEGVWEFMVSGEIIAGITLVVSILKIVVQHRGKKGRWIKMYKIIPNKTSLLQFENETKNTLFLWKNRPAVNNIKTMAEQLDIYYGKNRDIFADMGGYIVIIYGETTEIEKEHEEILNRHFLKKDFYEFEDIYEHEGETVTVRLYLCSSDYSVATVSVVHG